MNSISILMAVTIAAASTAVVETAKAAPSVGVSYADLNLSQAAGRATLEARVGRAVSRLCPMPYGGDLRAMTEYRACKATAWTSVQPQLATAYSHTTYAVAAAK